MIFLTSPDVALTYFTRPLVSGIESVKEKGRNKRFTVKKKGYGKEGFSRFVRGPKSRGWIIERGSRRWETGICKNFDYFLKMYVCTRFLNKSKSMIWWIKFTTRVKRSLYNR